ncbi:MAG: response regulator transcription factor [Acidobacteriota bacterium]
MYALLIEDHDDLAINICEYLEEQGFTMDVAGDGVTGLHLATVNAYDVIALDLTLPGLDGLEVCRKLRREARKSTPVLMLTARDTLENKLDGFASGGDDYLVKPFELRELEARLQALHRRANQQHAGQRLQVDDLVFDLETMEITRAAEPLCLTKAQMAVLRLLMERSPGVVTRQELERAVWGDEPPDSDTLRSHIHGVRSQVDKPFDRALLHTVHGIGYRLH